MVLDDRGVVALRPQNVLGAAVEDEDIVCVSPRSFEMTSRM